MKNIMKISAAAFSILLGSCIKDVTPTEIATEDQVTLETLVGGIPAALVKPGRPVTTWPGISRFRPSTSLRSP